MQNPNKDPLSSLPTSSAAGTVTFLVSPSAAAAAAALYDLLDFGLQSQLPPLPPFSPLVHFFLRAAAAAVNNTKLFWLSYMCPQINETLTCVKAVVLK